MQIQMSPILHVPVDLPIDNGCDLVKIKMRLKSSLIYSLKGYGIVLLGVPMIA